MHLTRYGLSAHCVSLGAARLHFAPSLSFTAGRQNESDVFGSFMDRLGTLNGLPPHQCHQPHDDDNKHACVFL